MTIAGSGRSAGGVTVAAVTRRRGWRAIAVGFAFSLPVVFLTYYACNGQGVGP